ncbi:hypothetical protein BH09PLA1_BH09PLA1_12750 [soil metagenome]
MRLRSNSFLDRLPDQRRPDMAGAMDAILERAAYLRPDERRLVELVVKNQLTYRQLSELFSVPTGTVSRRVRRAMNRLCDPFVVTLLDPANPLPPDYRQLAIEHRLQGLSFSQLAEKHQITTRQVLRMLEFVRGWQRATTMTAPSRSRQHRTD